jgi:hypothetical protein
LLPGSRKVYPKRDLTIAMASLWPYSGICLRWSWQKLRKSSMPWIWSACVWVYNTASIRCRFSRKACCRRSGPLSISSTSPLGVCSTAELRVRRLRRSDDVQVVQLHPMTGVPALEPHPRMVSCTVAPDGTSGKSFPL